MVISSGSASSRMRAELVGRPQDLDAVDADAALQRVVVDEADGREAELRVAHELAHDQPPALAGADDEHPPRVGAGAEAAHRALVDDPRGEARAADQHQREQEEERHDARRRRDRDLAGARR